MYDILIYGEIVPFQEEIQGCFNLSMLNSELEKANKQPLLVRINSVGGDVEEGFSIYQALRRYSTENKVEITTRCDGRCSSIATVFYLAGDKRIVNEYNAPFVHNAWTYAMGDAKELQRISIDLQDCNNRIAQHYANHTDLTFDEALELMQNETSITPEECVKIRFATEIESVERPKALQRFNKINNNNNKKMDSNLIEKLNGFLNKAERLFSKNSIKNLEVFTSTNEPLDFYELGADDMPKIGDKANIGGQTADGSYTLADGVTTYIFANGTLTEIVEPAEENNEVENLKKENETLKAEIETLKSNVEVLNKLEDEVKNYKEQINSFKALSSDYKATLEEITKTQSTINNKVDVIENFKLIKKNK